MVGLTRDTVNGILHTWRDQGIVERDRRSIRLRDPERLRRVRLEHQEAGYRGSSGSRGQVATPPIASIVNSSG